MYGHRGVNRRFRREQWCTLTVQIQKKEVFIKNPKSDPCSIHRRRENGKRWTDFAHKTSSLCSNSFLLRELSLLLLSPSPEGEGDGILQVELEEEDGDGGI